MTTKSATEAPSRARRVGIVGTGVSGLATAHFLLRSGVLERGDVLELQDERSKVGGVLEATIEGGFLFERS